MNFVNKKLILYFIYPLLLFLLSTSAIKVFSGAYYLVPQLVLLFVIIFATTHSFAETLWMSFALGFLQELFSGVFFGAYIIAFVMTGLLVYFITRNLTAQEVSAETVIFLVVLTTFLFDFWIFGYNNLASLLGISLPLSLRHIYSAKIVWTIVVNFLFFYPLELIFKILIRYNA